jgi:hypothetical protein
MKSLSREASSQPFETLTSATPPWTPVKILDTERMPWEETVMPWQKETARPSAPRAKSPFSVKGLYVDKKTNLYLVIIYVPPGRLPAFLEYHTYHEWALGLYGDLTNNESVGPDQRFGAYTRYKEGYWMDRPAFSVHGDATRFGFLQSQMGGALYHMIEIGVRGKSFSPERQSPNYDPEYKKIKHWAVPRIIDTIEQLPWERDASVPGLYLKRLTDDPGRGFRARLLRLEPGWNSSRSAQFARAYYYKQAYQFSFVLSGDLAVQTHRAPGEPAERVTLGKYFHLERAPRSICGLADGVVTERGVIWFEVTYAKGPSISETPIEEPNYV